jgi:hypothetical protein
VTYAPSTLHRTNQPSLLVLVTPTIRLGSRLDIPKHFREWMMMPYTGGKCPVPDNKAGQAASRKQAIKEREKKQNAFIAHCRLDDVIIVKEESLKQLRGCSKTTALQTIKSACINQLGAIVLCQFCIHNKIEGYRNKTKHQLVCDMMIERKRHRNLDEVMYPNDFDYKDDDNDS